MTVLSLLFFFFFNDTATTEIYTLSLHDALPISRLQFPSGATIFVTEANAPCRQPGRRIADAHGDPRLEFAFPKDRKSTRLNSSHANISYAVFCLKKKKNNH